ncbi:MAG: biosynthetic arginine decarboxylase [Planctomycetota bacterium]|jgi:arginine decarboxylase|nr:biosynthetic arginine decarboxylase [Planctomycetota bacterium]
MPQKRPRLQQRKTNPFDAWTPASAAELYGLDRWGQGIFTVNDAGHVALAGPDGNPGIDVKNLVKEIQMRGFELPALIRFTDVLAHRFRVLHESFAKAMREHDYRGAFRPVYPIKVNQHRHVIEDIVALGGPLHHGLEAGSKPELLIAVSHLGDPDAVIICNGFKDAEYVDTALLSRRLGHNIFLVIEKPFEVDLILDRARALGIAPLLGVRIKLSARGRGAWESSSGDRSKFGLDCQEIIQAVQTLKRRKALPWLQLLHCHIGSQVTDIQRFKTALREAGSFFREIRKLGVPLTRLDLGGGLAVDYDGSKTNFASSANYTPQEYAADVVDAVSHVCNEAGLPHPDITIESGRALVAHHALLVIEALSCTGPDETPPPPPRNGVHEVVRRICDILEGIGPKNFQEAFHDALQARQDALVLFSHGHLGLAERAAVETRFRHACRLINRHARVLDYVPDDLAGLERMTAATYFCNFSVFQSIPDHWAIRQLFPVMPLHRLREKPAVPAILADITCDSDGVVDQFVDLRDVRHTLPLHPLRRGEPYYLGVFLVGAYQEILGDLHNLFGDTTVAHVSSSSAGYAIDKIARGDAIMDVLGYVQFTRDGMFNRLRERVEGALKRGDLSFEESAALTRRFELLLDADTYLNSGRAPVKFEL